MTITCWCGNTELSAFSQDYMQCKICLTLVSLEKQTHDITRVTDDSHDFYSKEYWFSHQTKDLGLPNLLSRARSDLPERCLHWLNTLLKYKLPPSRVLELGSAHGGFVAMLRWAGFDATGLELSPWVVDFARKTFSIPMLLGPVEDQDIKSASLDIIVIMDTLEHLPDPVTTLQHCLSLLKPDGILFIQTPCLPLNKTYKKMIQEKNSFLSLLIKKEHLYLFSKKGIKKLFHALGAEHIKFEPAIFSHYDISFVVSKKPFNINPTKDIQKILTATPDSRLIQSMIDISNLHNSLQEKYEEAENDRAARLEVINSLQKKYEEAENDRAARLEVINSLQKKYEKAENDRAARLEVINSLQKKYEGAENDRAAKLEQIHKLSKQLEDSEDDRAARLEQIQKLSKQLEDSEDDRAARLEVINKLSIKLEDKDRELESIKTSFPWKITLPFRWINSSLKRITFKNRNLTE